MIDFQELRVRVRHVGGRRYLVLANGPANAASVVQIGDEPATLQARFTKLIDIELGQARNGGTEVATELRRLGRDLFDLLFDDELGACLRASRSQAERDGCGLRLRFDLPPELHDLPIEALCSAADSAGQTLALNATLSLARTMPGEPVSHRLPGAKDESDFIRLLVAIATPSGHGLPAIESKVEIDALRALPNLAVRTTILQHATRRNIASWLGEHADLPAAVLLIAHGEYDETRDEGIVLLENADGTADPTPSHLLSGILVGAQRLRLVVLNLCSGAWSTTAEPFSGLAQALIGRGVPAVAAMNGLVTDRAASIFGPQLLDGICSNKTIDEAMTLARQQIAHLPRHTTIEWATPTLFLHESLGHGWLFKAREVQDAPDYEWTDPLRQGEAALARLNAPGNVKLSTVLAAARHLCTGYDWDQALRIARTRKPTAEQTLLITEAQIETALPTIERLCEVLASEQDPDPGAELLDRVRHLLPDTLLRALDTEIAQAGRLCELVGEAQRAETQRDWRSAARCYEEILGQRPAGFRDVSALLANAREEAELADRYARGESHRLAGRWPEALVAYREILELRPDGYRATTAWTVYSSGRVAEAQRRWAEAIAAYRGCADFEEAPGRLAYASGRAAADADEWSKAHREFVIAADLGVAPDEWSDYAVGRAAESAGDLEAAGEAYARLTGFLDAEERLLFTSGRLAAASGDPAAAARAFERLAAAGWDVAVPLDEARDALYEKAATFEEALAWPEAAACYGGLPPGYRDAREREEYAEGRVAESAEDWALAVECYQANEHADAASRLSYARGHVAERARQWDVALQHYAALPKTFLDADARAHYAAGRSADDRADWAGVIEGFAELPDGFADGEVGRRRRFARAKIAEQSGDWRSILALLSDAADDDRDGSVGLLRAKARGRLAEDEGNWSSAAAIYVSAEGGDPELDRSNRYARGRCSELEDSWSGALDEYAALAGSYRDVAVRSNYARARLAEEEPDGWPLAVGLYAALPGDFQDVAVRSGYARLRVAIASQDWDGAPEMAETRGDYRDTATLVGYARGRSAERRADWARAITSYRTCAGYADSAVRLEYATGRQLDDAGLWSAAIATYERATPAIPAAEQRRNRLARLLAAIPWADGLAESTLVADPVALREETFPYLALRSAGVTPASPTEIVQDVAYTLMERGGIDWRERVAWDQLRTPAKRLLVDARLYQLADPDALSRELTALDPSAKPSLLAWLCARLPDDAALFTLLAGNRTDAIEAWRQRLTESPGDLAAVHCLAIASFWQAQELEDTGAWEQAEQVWRSALACWAVLLSSDEFWIGWRQARASRYGHAVTPADTARLRAELGRYLIDLLTRHADGHAGAWRPKQAEHYRDLISFFEAELKAAQCLKEAGGLPMRDEAGGMLTCGPAYLRMVGLIAEFGEFVALADPPAIGDTESRGAVLRQLRWSFSGLSTAFALLEHHRFESALRALPESLRQVPGEAPTDCAGPAAEVHGSIDDCPHCQDFLSHNPAYTYLPRRSFRLLQDAVGLAVRARLSIARGLLTGPGQVDRAMTELTEAIVVSATAMMGGRTRQAVLRMILGRVDALAELGVKKIDRLDEAIILVEKALPVVGGPGREQLTRKWADLLVSRGVWYGSTCIAFGIRPDMTRSVAELRAALALSPDSAWVRYNLAKALTYSQDELPGGDTTGKLTILLEALRVVHTGLEQAATNNRLQEALGELLEAVGSVLLAKLSVDELGALVQTYGEDAASELDARERARALAEEARLLAARGDLTGSAHHLVRAARADPGSTQVREALAVSLEALLATPREEGDASR